MTHQEKIDWIIGRHRATNHMYDDYLPYEFHLRMAVEVARKFKHLIPAHRFDEYELGVWGHDLIEDTRTSYNDCKKVLGYFVAEVIYALTNGKGKTRKERADERYYKGIRETEGSIFGKLCDRIANVQYSAMSGSDKFEMYRHENPDFIKSLDCAQLAVYREMVDYLQSIFDDRYNNKQ